MFLDTSGLLCLLSPREEFHSKAVEVYRRTDPHLTHGFVISELVALGHARRLPAKKVVTYLQDLLANPLIDIVWPDGPLTAQALILLSTRVGAGYSLCDAVSFVLMRERGVAEALTQDAHFSQEGFQRLLA